MFWLENFIVQEARGKEGNKYQALKEQKAKKSSPYSFIFRKYSP